MYLQQPHLSRHCITGVAKFSEEDDFCVYLPEGQQWRSNSTIKVRVRASACVLVRVRVRS